ncbi:MAG: hypothetical protein O2865_09475 [Planctomycetota bacterium]|nr:hypothetical protein [Planctomycetota bacterium]
MFVRNLAFLGLAAALPAQEQGSLAALAPQGLPNFVYVGDVMPHIKALLTSERLDEAWKEMAPGLATIEPSLRGVAPRSFLGPLELFEAQVPVEIAMSFPERTMVDYGALLHGGLALAFGYMVVDQGGIDEPALDGFRDLAAELFNDVGVPAFHLAVRARSERIAEGWFDAALDMLESLAVVEGMQVVVEDQSFRVQVLLGDLLDSPVVGPGGMFGMADASGVLPADHGATEQIRAWLGSLEVTAQLTQRGDVLELRVGDLPAGDQEGTSAGRTVSADTMLQVEWESAGFLPYAEGAYDMVFEFGDETMDFLDMVAPGQYWSLLDTLTEMSATAPTGASRIDVTDGEIVLDLVEGLEEEGFVPPRLQDTGIEDYIPEDLAMSTASSFWTLDEFVLVQFDEILVSLYDLSVDLWEQGFEDASDEIDVWAAYFEDDLAEVHEFFEGEDSAYFAEGTVVMVEKMEDGSTPAVAMVGLPYGRDEGEDFVAELAEIIRNIDGSEASAETFLAAVEDGIEAIVFDVPGFDVTPETFAEAEFAPHAVFVGDALVLSTSPAFTRRILAAKGDAGDPAWGARTAQFHTTGEQVGRMMAAVVSPLLGDSREGRRGRALVRALQVGLGMIESIDVVDVDGAEQFQQQIRIRY